MKPTKFLLILCLLGSQMTIAKPLARALEVADKNYSRNCEFYKFKVFCDISDSVEILINKNKAMNQISSIVLSNGGTVEACRRNPCKFSIPLNKFPRARADLGKLSEQIKADNIREQADIYARSMILDPLKNKYLMEKCANVKLRSSGNKQLSSVQTGDKTLSLETSTFIGSGGTKSASCKLTMDSSSSQATLDLSDWELSRYIYARAQVVQIEFKNKNANDTRKINLECGEGSGKYPVTLEKMTQALSDIGIELQCNK